MTSTTDRWKQLDFAPPPEEESSEPSVLLDYLADNRIATITLNRPLADNAIDTELPLAAAEQLLASLPSPQNPTDTAFYLQHCVRACKAGVERSHIIPFAVDGSLLLEVYVHD